MVLQLVTQKAAKELVEPAEKPEELVVLVEEPEELVVPSCHLLL